MSESYENLAGAEGKARFFRPKRFAAGKLFAAAPPRVWFEDHEFLLDNISATGAGCRARDFEPDEEGDRRGVLRLTQFGREIFSAKARLVRTGFERGSVVIGLSLDGTNFPLDDLIRKNASALALGFAVSAPDRSTVPIEYKSYCADVMAFVGGYLNHIDRHFSPIEEKLDSKASDEIIMELTEGATPLWRTLLEEGNDLILPIHRNKSQRAIFKKYTERVVTRELAGGQSWGRSYHKPMGYPGDYKIMNYMYDGTPEGDCLHTKFLHMLGVVAGQPIVTRMTALAGLILDHAAADKDRQDTFNIMSIGSGPARELEPLVQAGGGYKWRATLVDQEPAALEYALNKAAGAGMSDSLSVAALNISFRDMLSASSLREKVAEQDIIYSSGLVDYLNPLMAMRFVRRMYDYLKPGGKLIIGNVNDLRTGTLWAMEYVLDWTLYFRNEDEMRAMAGETPGAIVSLESDPLNAIHFLVVDKPLD